MHGPVSIVKERQREGGCRSDDDRSFCVCLCVCVLGGVSNDPSRRGAAADQCFSSAVHPLSSLWILDCFLIEFFTPPPILSTPSQPCQRTPHPPPFTDWSMERVLDLQNLSWFIGSFLPCISLTLEKWKNSFFGVNKYLKKKLKKQNKITTFLEINYLKMISGMVYRTCTQKNILILYITCS